jgi:ATP-binding cassette subfamily F protein 3
MLSFSDLSLRRSATLLFEAADFKIYPGQKLGITGANGCGKTSLFALIRGELSSDQGHFTMPQDWAVASVEQEAQLSERIALEYVIDGDEELRRVETRLVEAEAKADALSIASWQDSVLARPKFDDRSIASPGAGSCDSTWRAP